MAHADNQIFLPPAGYQEDPAAVVFVASRVRCLPMRVAVLMDQPAETFDGSEILVPQGQHAGKYRSDTGTVVSSGVASLRLGDRVAVKPYDGYWAEDRDWIPAGRQVRMYGISSEWWDSIVAKLPEVVA